MNKFCQSCGMPMKKDPKNGGTNADGSQNSDYCSYCYKEGVFQDDCNTAKEMQKFCIGLLTQEKMPKLFAWLLTRGIPKLKRWQ